MSVRHIAEIICDGCGEPSAGSYNGTHAARVDAIQHGWKHPAFGRDYCPECEVRRDE